MKAKEIREKYINYFIKNGHKQVESASVLPDGDSSVLFTTAGMQQFVPYLLGEKHPKGDKLVDYQKCVRTVDIDEVGDNRHLTFFEMLGNWSLGAYFKEESITLSYNFLKDELKLPMDRISVTCFEGDSDAPRDEVSANVWNKLGIPNERIYFFNKKENWWIAGEEGPCGPDTEIFFDTGKSKCSENCNPSCDCGKYVEIWNNVFMEYFKKDGKYTKLAQKNVDTGMGLERITMIMENKQTPFELEIFKPVIDKLIELASTNQKDNIQSMRIITDHLRSSSIIIADGGRPKNTDQGYILRRLIRRALRHIHKLEINQDKIKDILEVSIDTSKELYDEIGKNSENIINIFLQEKDKFFKTLIQGEKELNKLIEKKQNYLIKNALDGKVIINGEDLFMLFERYGLPIEISKELISEKDVILDTKSFDELFKAHQEKSKMSADKKFKGGLADTNENTIKYHTATHLLHSALRKILGDDVYQKGSNITEERLRFDFSYPEKVEDSKLKEIEDLVNKKINEALEVKKIEMTLEEAKKQNAIGLFENKYQDKVFVYKIGDFSLEMCGGPHVKNTKELGKFKIVKESASSKGVRRIKAILE